MSTDPSFVKAILAKLDAGTVFKSRIAYASEAARKHARNLLLILERESISPVGSSVSVTADGDVRLTLYLNARTVTMLVGESPVVRCRFCEADSIWTDEFGSVEKGGATHVRNVLAWVEGMPPWTVEYPGRLNREIADAIWQRGF